jgi:acetyl/propionyl-CoA carboxylase alpha subunit/acetyl-CoA carboxylase carboxyltransferase component
MPTRVLIANRGEIAIRIAQACADLGIASVAVHPDDDATSLHTRRADEAHLLPGTGAAAYLDIPAIIAAAHATRCDAIHPGYGFLSENPAFARACTDAGLVFIGPIADTLALFGDKTAARALATQCDVPTPRGTGPGTTLDDARAFLASLGEGAAVMVKAVSGGGGRGMRPANSPTDLADAWTRCASEAQAAFGAAALYVEERVTAARHIEIQVIGDGTGAVTHLGDRDCTLQRRHQKIIEFAPSAGLPAATRDAMAEAALRMAAHTCYRGLATFEFLLDTRSGRFLFIEANPRLQVEHTVTEATTGIDLVQTQLRIAAGATLAELGLSEPILPSAHAIQLRINTETMQPDGSAHPAGGLLSAYEPPSGPGIRVDGAGYAGYRTNPRYDSLLAKLIVTAPDPATLLVRARRAVAAFRIEGAETNLPFLAALLQHPDVTANHLTTVFVDHEAPALIAAAAGLAPARFFAGVASGPAEKALAETTGPAGTTAVRAPMQGLVVSLDLAPGDLVRAGQQVAVLEAMKMEHVITAPVSGILRACAVTRGEVAFPGQPLLFIEERDLGQAEETIATEIDLDAIRPDLAEARARKDLTADAARPDAIAKRHRQGGRSARENIADLADPGSFHEYGALTIAAQRTRRSEDELRRTTPADGLVAGLATINAGDFGPQRASAMIVSYDYTVLAGTQGTMNHKKQDRIYQLAAELKRPLVLFAEGGGGRPGDTDKEHLSIASLDTTTFNLFAKLSGLIPLVGVVHGRCFAGNAALLGCCDVIIATEATTLGMGGPAMIEGGGLGVYTAEEVGPVGVMAPNGVIDILVRDETEAVAAAKKYLSYFQGPLAAWSCPDQRHLRRLIPENRLRAYDVRPVIDGLADTGSVLELRPSFGLGMITALIRIEGRSMGLIANNPLHLGGAIDADAADKAARFIQLCDAHDLPILSLIDTPGFMVGPEAEKAAQVRRVCRMFVGGANVDVPIFAIALRKGYGLGALAMVGGNFHASVFTISWPTGEFGGMGFEGAVRLAYRKELEAIADPAEREAEFRSKVDAMYRRGKAISMAGMLEIDDVIDPADTRSWLVRGLNTVLPPPVRHGKKRNFIDTW